MNADMIVTLIESSRDQLVRTAQAVPDARLNWRPLDNGRTVLDLLGDAAQSPQMATLFLGAGSEKPSPDAMRQWFQKMREERASWTRDECLQHLQTNMESASTAIRALSPEQLAEPLTLPMGGGMTLPMGAWWMAIINRSLTARMGQINYIQTLYGDCAPH